MDAAAKILAAIAALPRGGRPLLVSIDGRCAAGKTTLAARLGRELGGPVLPMDAFFLRPEQRSPERLQTPGGNIDHERFLAEALLPLRAGTPFSYRPFDCRTMALAAPVLVEPAPVCLIEGSYSCHPALWDYSDLHVFLSVEPEEQLRRLRLRNGEAGASVFQSRWIPLEEAYFSAFRVAERCELCLCG